MGFPITTRRARFIEDVVLVAEEMAFPVDRENALSLVQLTLGMLAKERDRFEKEIQGRTNGEARDMAKRAGDAFVRTVLRRSEDSGRPSETEGGDGER